MYCVVADVVAQAELQAHSKQVLQKRATPKRTQTGGDGEEQRPAKRTRKKARDYEDDDSNPEWDPEKNNDSDDEEEQPQEGYKGEMEDLTAKERKADSVKKKTRKRRGKQQQTGKDDEETKEVPWVGTAMEGSGFYENCLGQTVVPVEQLSRHEAAVSPRLSASVTDSVYRSSAQPVRLGLRRCVSH